MTRLILRMNVLSRAPALALIACVLTPALASAQELAASGAAPAFKARTCSVEGLMGSIRRGLHSNSEAYKLYLRTLLRESAVNLPLAELQAAFEREHDPVMVEQLAAALVARTERGLEDAAMKAVAQRALDDRDPALRAATIRALRRTGALEHTGDLFERLVRDPSPEVRMEAATNLVEDNLHVYGGHNGPAADSAVAAAASSSDPKVTAHILGQLTTGEVSTESARKSRAALAQRLRPKSARRPPPRSAACPPRRWPAPGNPWSACTTARTTRRCARPSSRASPGSASPARRRSCSGCAASIRASRPRSTPGSEFSA